MLNVSSAITSTNLSVVDNFSASSKCVALLFGSRFSARLLELLNFLEIEGKRLIRFVGYELLKFSKRREEKKEEEE